MKRAWKIALGILAVLVIWFGSALLLRASLSASLTDTERTLLREELTVFWGSNADFYADVLYDSQGTPLWMYGESDGGSVILNRITLKIAEAGEVRYYKDYHDVPKYYAAPLAHIVESKYVPNDLDRADTGYFFMGPNEHLDDFSPGVIGWISSNLKLPLETLKSVMSGNKIPIG